MTNEIAKKTTRNVTVLQTRGAKTVVLEVPGDVTTFGQLKRRVSDAGVNYDIQTNVAIESVNNTTLELDNAVLPEGDFMLGIISRKTKAGSIDRKMLYTRIKEFVQRDGKDRVNNYFKDKTGKHYTNISSEELEELVNSYGTSDAVEEVQVEEVVEPVSGTTSVIELLRKAGVGEEAIQKVREDLSGTKVDRSWLDEICKNHPLVRC